MLQYQLDLYVHDLSHVRFLEIVHKEMEKALRPGMTTKDIDRLGEEVIRSYGCVPSFLNYNGYPASVCVSINDEVVHGKKSLLDKLLCPDIKLLKIVRCIELVCPLKAQPFYILFD